jgi:alpha-beta hydrolase superfamily lysophospholipase
LILGYRMNNPHLSTEATLIYLPTPDGHKIPLRHWPVATPRAVIHIVHGMAEHSGNYDDVAAFFNQHHFSVLAHDHRCHGLSSELPLGNVDKAQNWQGVLDDMPLIHNWIKATYQQLPVVIIGHSMGSFISQHFVENNPNAVTALALSGSDFLPTWFTGTASKLACLETRRQGANGRSALIHSLAFGKFSKAFTPARTEYDWLSRSDAWVDHYVADKLCGFQMANAYWRDFLKTLSQIYTPANLKKIPQSLPVYIFAGTEDPVGHKGKGVTKLAKMHNKVRKTEVVLKLYNNGRHDILHETNASEVRYDLLSWLLAHIAKAS